MTSHAYREWVTTRRQALDEIAAAHRAVGGSGPGRRRATEQINHAYVVLLSSQFQGYCRDLHTEAAHVVALGVPSNLRDVVWSRMVAGRLLDRGNPTPGNVGADFSRFGLRFWDEVRAVDRRHQRRRLALEELSEWRNAIAHQDFSRSSSNRRRLRLQQVRRWRSTCNVLARTFDQVLAGHLTRLAGARPW